MKRYCAPILAGILCISVFQGIQPSANVDSVDSFAYDLNQDGNVNAKDLTLALRSSTERENGLADAIMDYLMTDSYEPEILYPVVTPYYNFKNEDAASCLLPVETAIDTMTVIKTEAEWKALTAQGKQIAVYGDPKLPAQTAFVTTSVEQSADTELCFDKVIRKNGEYSVTMIRRMQNNDTVFSDTPITPADMVNQQIHFQLNNRDYHGEKVTLTVIDEFEMNGTTCQSFCCGMIPESSKPISQNTGIITSYSEYLRFLQQCSYMSPFAQQIDTSVFQDSCLLVGLLRNTDSYYNYHTYSITPENDKLNWKVEQIMPLNGGDAWVHYDVLAAIIPKEYQECIAEIEMQTICMYQ